jgi:DNA-binding transcriptional ArsR family regulator
MNKQVSMVTRLKSQTVRPPRAGPAVPEKAIRTLSETFKTLGDPTRLRICVALAVGERNVGDLAAHLRLSESAVSHQLRLLKALRLVAYRRVGRMTFYRLDDRHIEELIRMGMHHVDEEGDGSS